MYLTLGVGGCVIDMQPFTDKKRMKKAELFGHSLEAGYLYLLQPSALRQTWYIQLLRQEV